ncbi:hypothetical protein VVD49_12845 [Uliginosibacterium sp. H3]|uniref:Uncharacterized protein n=1 Tax=Uliginosibacterium silvisoli TaxID=3114758 RepID=A0ABU6K4X7_9RHOO|nr:hypothetical protein [Uliginosibacterium sp. H3]
MSNSSDQSGDVSTLPHDAFISLTPRDAQQQAARLVQEAFAAAFRLSIEAGAEQRQSAIEKLTGHLAEWAGMASRDEALLRRTLLLAGLDQWGLAFSETFGPKALSGVSVLVSLLRNELDVQEEAISQGYLERLQNEEGAAFDFKVLLRRELHLALWHAMIAAEERDEAEAIMRHLGGLLLGVYEEMPTHGWRLIADALASIQMRCLSQGLAIEGIAQETTQSLFVSLASALPEEVCSRVMEQSSTAVRAWQEARRSVQH